MDAEFQFENQVEAGLWVTMALILAIAGFCSRRWRVQALLTALVLVMFGGPDLVEAQTGAWWRPWWLFVWKTACVVVLTGSVIYYYMRRRSLANTSAATPLSIAATTPTADNADSR